MLANRILKISSSKTSATRNRAAALKKQGVSIINLTAGELEFDTHPEIRRAAIEAIQENKNRYTETIGIDELREAVASQATKKIGIPFSTKHVAITHGAKQGLFNTIFALFNPGDKVIVPTPCWGTFIAQLTMLGIEPVLLNTSANNFQINPTKLRTLIDENVKGIILNTPNNPTGVIYNKEHLKKIAEIIKEFDLWLIYDECYSELYFPEERPENILSLDPDIRDRTVIINSFSKSHAITGWRIGYAIGPERLIKGIKAIQSHSTSNPNVIAQYAVLPVYQDSSIEFIYSIRSKIFHNFVIAKEILNSIPHISYVEPTGAFYFFVNFKWYLENNDRNISSIDDLCEYFLLEGHIAVVSGSAFYDPYHVRISISGSEQDISDGLNRIKQALIKLPIRELAGVL